MRLLLDTHVALWAITDSPRLATLARNLILDPANSIYISTAAVWEITIKHMIGKGNMPVSGTQAAALSGQRAISNFPLPMPTSPSSKRYQHTTRTRLTVC